MEDLLVSVENAIISYERVTGNPAGRTRKMLADLGPITMLEKLVMTDKAHKGFCELRDEGKLEETFEAVVIKFSDLFSKDAVEFANWRLSVANDL